MGSRSKVNPVPRHDDWHYLRVLLTMYDLIVDDHPSSLAREVFDEALLLARLKTGEEIPGD